jgi:hypothetical protein
MKFCVKVLIFGRTANIRLSDCAIASAGVWGHRGIENPFGGRPFPLSIHYLFARVTVLAMCSARFAAPLRKFDAFKFSARGAFASRA